MIKLAQVILNRLEVVLDIKKIKIELAGVGLPGVALQEHTPFIDCDVTFKSYFKHVRGCFGNFIYENQYRCVCVPYRNTHRSSDGDETFTSCCKHARGGYENLKNLKIVLAGVPGVALSLEEHTPSMRLR